MGNILILQNITQFEVCPFLLCLPNITKDYKNLAVHLHKWKLLLKWLVKVVWVTISSHERNLNHIGRRSVQFDSQAGTILLFPLCAWGDYQNEVYIVETAWLSNCYIDRCSQMFLSQCDPFAATTNQSDGQRNSTNQSEPTSRMTWLETGKAMYEMTC